MCSSREVSSSVSWPPVAVNQDSIQSLAMKLNKFPKNSGATFTPSADKKSGVFTWTVASNVRKTTYGVTFTATNSLSGSAKTSIKVVAPTLIAGTGVTAQTTGADEATELEGDIDGRHVTLDDLDGRPIRLADLRGKVVWINFWATWCPPCQEETPVLRDVYERYQPDGLELVANSVQETTADDVRQYVETYDLRFTVGFDATSAVFQTYRAFGLPTQYFIDREGVIQHIVLGPVTRDQAANLIVPLLEE